MKHLTKIAAAVLAISVIQLPCATEAVAQEENTEKALELSQASDRLIAYLQGEGDIENVFSADFLAAVPPDQFKTTTRQLIAQFGPVVGMRSITPRDSTTATVEIEFEKAIGNAMMSVETDAPYLINGLQLVGFDSKDDSYNKVKTDFEALPGKAGFLVARISDTGMEEVASRNMDAQFGIGSTFKLYVLAELAAQVQDGKREWSDVVTVDQKSFPSGITQNWPDSAPVTLQTLATLMISISDNTATDVLIRTLGRDNIARRLKAIGHDDPDRTLPFLTTVEAFGLKQDDQEKLRRQFLEASEIEQAKILEDAKDSLIVENINIEQLAGTTPMFIEEIEWFASPNDSAKLMDYLRKQNDPTALAIMGVNGGLPEINAAQWDYIGFKGGSEPGVVSLNYLLRAKDGDWYAVTGSWNNPAAAVETQTFATLMARLTSLAAK